MDTRRRSATISIGLQARIVARPRGASTARAFRRDEWTRAEGGGGVVAACSRTARVLERAGVLFSHVRGERLPPSATAQRPALAGRAWEAMGVSLVLHPRNPHAPTVHLNVRCFVAAGAGRRRRRCGGSAAAWTSRRTTATTTTRGISIARAATRSRRSAPTCIRASSARATSTSS